MKDREMKFKERIDCGIAYCEDIPNNQIEEMAKVIESIKLYGADNYERKISRDSVLELAEELLEHYQPKLPENSISTSQEEMFDILSKMEFFQGQRAGRELWNDKPKEVQDKDISDFVKGINYIRSYLKANVVLSREEYNALLLEQKRLKEMVDRIPCGYELKEKTSKETAEKFMVLRGYITKQFHHYHEVRNLAEEKYKKCKEEMGKAVLNNDWHRADAIMFILEKIAIEFDELAKQFGVEIKE